MLGLDSQICLTSLPFVQQLCGRGKDAFNNIGNRRLRLLVANNLQEYIMGTRHGKTQVIRDIVHQVQQAGGRFVKRSANGDRWHEIDTNQARDKVGHIFRDSLRQKQHRQKRQHGRSKSTVPKKYNNKKTTSGKNKSNKKAAKTSPSSTGKSTPIKEQRLHASQNSIFRGMNLYCSKRTSSIICGGGHSNNNNNNKLLPPRATANYFPDKSLSSPSPPQPSLLNLLVQL